MCVTIECTEKSKTHEKRGNEKYNEALDNFRNVYFRKYLFEISFMKIFFCRFKYSLYEAFGKFVLNSAMPFVESES